MHFSKYLLLLALSLSVYAKGNEHNGTDASGAAQDHGGKNGTEAHGTAKDHGGKKNGTDHKGHNHKDIELFECAEITRLTALTNLVNNSTALAAFESHHNLSSTEIQKLKGEAANATTKLTQLQSNTTLVHDCAVIDASEKLKAQCHKIDALTKLADLTNNATALQALESKHNLTSAEITKIKAEAANATAELTKLQSNATLVTACMNLASHTNATCMLCTQVKPETYNSLLTVNSNGFSFGSTCDNVRCW